MRERVYIAIDLKSFYSSVECVERSLDPLRTNLVVADSSRTEKTICLAVSPSLKEVGVSSRPRLFEVVQKVKEVNRERLAKNHYRPFHGKSVYKEELEKDPGLELDYIVATPQMKRYMEVSRDIYEVYLKYIAPEDIHVYSIDEVFIDATAYLNTYQMSAHELCMTMVRDVLQTTGITATAGIAPNMYLCKVAMDIVAKHSDPDKDGVRIAELDETSYRRLLWDHLPLTDFWRVGPGTVRRLAEHKIYTMGDIARCSLGEEKDVRNQALLYELFGVNAELLIDHAWGIEPTTMQDIRSYVPETHSLSQGQVLSEPYDHESAALVISEMCDMLCMDMLEKKVVTDQIVLTVGYDIKNLENEVLRARYKGQVTVDMYGRSVPKSAHGSANLPFFTNSNAIILEKMMELYERICDPKLLVRRMYVVANHVVAENSPQAVKKTEQLDLFTDMDSALREEEKLAKELEREKKEQTALLQIRKKYGKNAVLKGKNLLEKATARKRNAEIGGHKA